MSYVDNLEEFKRLQSPGVACFTIRPVTLASQEDWELALLVAETRHTINALRNSAHVPIALRAGVLVEDGQVVLPVVVRMGERTHVLLLNAATNVTPECLFLLATQPILPTEVYAEDGTCALRYDVPHGLGQFGEEAIEVLHVWDVAPLSDEVVSRLAREYPSAEAFWAALA